jgi:hypothetical protein
VKTRPPRRSTTAFSRRAARQTRIIEAAAGEGKTLIFARTRAFANSWPTSSRDARHPGYLAAR